MNFKFEHINRYILYKHHLTKEFKSSELIEVVEDLAGLHAQVPATPYLSLFARMEDFSLDMLDRHLYEDRSLGRIRCLRNTVFIIPHGYIPHFMSASRKKFELGYDQYPKYFGMTYEDFQKLSRSVLETLGKDGSTAKEIRKEVGGDVSISRAISQMCDLGILARGKPPGWRSSAYLYHSFKDFYGDMDYRKFDDYESKIFVIRKYLESYGPVTETDITWWTGFGKLDTRKVLNDLVEKGEAVVFSEGDKKLYMEVEDSRKFEVFKPNKELVVNLLPVMDPHIMGYKDRCRIIDSDIWNYVFDRSGNATSTVCIDGRVAGIWDFDKKKGMKLHLFRNMNDEEMNRILEEAKRTGFFLECGEEIRIYDKMTPLNERRAGGFMSPLKD